VAQFEEPDVTMLARGPQSDGPTGAARETEGRAVSPPQFVHSAKKMKRPVFEGAADFGRRLLLSEYFVLYLTVACFAVMAIFFPELASPRNLSNQLSNVWPLLAVAIGQTFVVIIGGIDLSQGAVMGFVSVVGAVIMTTAVDPNLLGGSPLWGNLIGESGGMLAGSQSAVSVAVVVMLAAGTLIGFVNGTLISRVHMPAFMVTLIALMLFSSTAIWLTQSQNLVNLPPEFNRLGAGDILSVYFGQKTEATIKRRDILPFVTNPMLITLALAVIAQTILSRTVFGHYMYAIGTNRRAAEISGVPVKRVVTMVFMFAGFCAAVAAIIYSARLQGGRPTIGSGSALLDIIGATVIGGSSLAGGKGKITWTFVGVVFFVLLSNTLNSIGLSAFYIDVVRGGIILAAAALDAARTRLLSREASG
jgi:ribose/xylose/arabinose/galactoside ABC-type transport system permease subunit